MCYIGFAKIFLHQFVRYLHGRIPSDATPLFQHTGEGARAKLALLELQDFLLFYLAHLFHLLDLVVGELLDFVDGALFVVF